MLIFICVVMYGNGVAIGMENIQAIHKQTQLVQNQKVTPLSANVLHLC